MMEINPATALVAASSITLAARCDLSPIVQSVSALFDSTHKGVVKIAGALFGGSLARLERDKILTEAQTDRDRKDVVSGTKVYQNGMLMSPGERKSYVDVVQLLKVEDTKRLLKCVASAANQIKSIPESEITDETVSKTFFNRWRKEAEQIDEQEMRDWWARILVEETRKTNSISVRTLDMAKNISHAEAEIFARVLRGRCENAIFTNRKGLSACGTFGDIITLQDAGLIKPERAIRSFEGAVDLEHPTRYSVHLGFDEVMIVCESKNLNIPCYLLTSAGYELSKIATINQCVDDIKTICKIVEESANGAKTYLQARAEFYGSEK